MTCVYETYSGSAFALVQLIPWIVPWAITLGSLTRDKSGRRGFEFTPFWYSFYLTFCQLLLYILQISVHQMREDPFCGPSNMSAAFPSSATFFVVAGVSFIFFLALLQNFVFDWKYWVYALVFFIVPPCYLVWLEYNSWWEILATALMALLANAAFFVILVCWASPQMPMLLNCVPNTWFSVTDTYWMSDEQSEEREEIAERLKACCMYYY